MSDRLATVAGLQIAAARQQGVIGEMDISDALACEEDERWEVARLYYEHVYHRSRYQKGCWETAAVLTLIWLLR